MSTSGCICAQYDNTNELFACWEPEPEAETTLPLEQVGGSSGSGSGAPSPQPAAVKQPKWTDPPWVDPNLKFVRPASDEVSACPTCVRHIWMHSPRHTRVPGKCRWHDKGSWHYTCPGCMIDLSKAHTYKHNWVPGECRWALKQDDVPEQREGKHPRTPRKKTKDHESADANAHELPEESFERQVAEDQEEPQPEASADDGDSPELNTTKEKRLRSMRHRNFGSQILIVNLDLSIGHDSTYKYH